jgi:hypothetical protein
VVVSNFSFLPLPLVAVVTTVHGVTVSFLLSFFLTLFSLPFAFFLSFSLYIISLHGLGQHSSRYSIGTRGQYFEKSSTCFISCRPGFMAYSGVGFFRRMLFRCWPVMPLFRRVSWSVLAPKTLLLFKHTSVSPCSAELLNICHFFTDNIFALYIQFMYLSQFLKTCQSTLYGMVSLCFMASIIMPMLKIFCAR